MQINYYSRLKYAHTVATSNGLTLNESIDVKVPSTNGHTINMPFFNPMWKHNSIEETEWWATLLHECYHNVHKGDLELCKKEKINMSSTFGNIYNIVVDHNIEYCESGTYEGRDYFIDKSNASLISKVMTNFKENNSTFSEDVQGIAAVVGLDLESRKQWEGTLGHINYDDSVSDVIKNKRDMLLPLFDEYNKKKTPEENLALARKIAKILGIKQEKEEEGEGMAEITDSGDMSEEDKEAVKGIIKHNHSDDSYEDGKPARGEYESDSGTSGVYVPSTPRVIDYTKGEERRGILKSFTYIKEEEITGSKLSTSIRKYLISQKKARYESGKKAGRIDKRRAWRASVMAGSPSSLNIRKQSVVKNTLNTAITLLVDQSGSMSGSRFQHACYSAILLNETFSKINIPVEIISFTHNRVTENSIHKTHNKSITTSQLVKQFNNCSAELMNNADGESILWAAERLMKRKEKRKVLIVLSDGEPAATVKQGSLCDYTKKVISELEKVIEVHGIGIETRSVSDYYKSNSVINNVNELEDKLIAVLKDKVLTRR